ncbi:MAG: hypothetical protein NVSMB46_00300 [Candidatus Saccharimonadales bacterium]
MSENYNPTAEQRALESRAAFKGFLDFVGFNIVDDAIKTAERNQEIGLKGVTIPSEDHSFMLTIDNTGVSFIVEEWGPYHVSLDTAKLVVIEKREEDKLH